MWHLHFKCLLFTCFSFAIQHVTDLSGRETLVRITGTSLCSVFLFSLAVCQSNLKKIDEFILLLMNDCYFIFDLRF